MPNYSKVKKEGHVTKIVGPTPYGSHTSMIVKDLGDGRVILLDENGEFTTTKDRLDTGLADANRYDLLARGAI
ncbi:MAG: hypothetical protein ACHQ1D_00620 [Nitrososphaerales archaeon]